LTTDNPGVEQDMKLFKRLGIETMSTTD